MTQREQIARIIEPEAWKWHDLGKYLERYEDEIQASLQKSDAILAAMYQDTGADWP
jgi:hypothetical protein